MCRICVNQSLINDVQHFSAEIQIQNWHRSMSHFDYFLTAVISLIWLSGNVYASTMKAVCVRWQDYHTLVSPIAFSFHMSNYWQMQIKFLIAYQKLY